MKKIIVTNITTLVFMLFFSVVQAQQLQWFQKCHPEARETYGVAFSSDGKKVLSGSECHNSRLRIFDVINGKIEWEYQIDSNLLCVAGVKFSTNGKYVSTLEETGNLLVFDYTLTPPSLVTKVNTGTFGAFSLDFSPDNSKIVTGLTNNAIKIYNMPAGTVHKSFVGHTGWVLCVAYSPNGNMLASGGNDDVVKIWDTNGTLKHTLKGHAADVFSVKFTPDNKYLISGAMDGTLKVWDTESGQLVRTLTGHKGGIRQVAIAPGGKWIASVSVDSTTRIWDIATGTQLASFSRAVSGRVYTVDWSSNATKLVTGTSAGDVLLWDIANITSAQMPGTNSTAISVYPNPTTKFVNISATGMVSLTVSNIAGQLIPLTITNENSNHWQADVSALAHGVYFVDIQTENGHTVQKLIIGE